MARESVKVLKNEKFENLVVNGDFRIGQRGTSNALVTDDYVLDRWICRKTAGNAEISQQFDGDDAYARLLSNTADSSLLQIGQQIEYRFFRKFLGKTMKFKFEAAGLNGNAASLTNSVIIYFRNDVQDGSVVWGSGATSTSSIVANLSGTSFEGITGEVVIPADTQAMFIQYGAPANQSYGIGDGFSVKNFMLYDPEFGDVEFDKGRNDAEEFKLCQEYFYQRTNADNGGRWFSVGTFIDSVRCDSNIEFPFNMRRIPDVGFPNINDFTLQVGTNSYNPTSMSAPHVTKEACRFRVQIGVGQTPASGGALIGDSTAEELTFDAEFY